MKLQFSVIHRTQGLIAATAYPLDAARLVWAAMRTTQRMTVKWQGRVVFGAADTSAVTDEMSIALRIADNVAAIRDAARRPVFYPGGAS
jgi:hypothetical protein